MTPRNPAQESRVLVDTELSLPHFERRKKLRKFALTTALAGMFAALWAGQALADTTIGQAQGGLGTCVQAVLVQSSGSTYVVPSGTWNLDSWSTHAGSGGGQMGVMVFRPAGGGSYTVVGESPVEALTAGTLNTFTLGSPITVQGGDLLGMYENGADCVANSSDTASYTTSVGEPAVGATFTPSYSSAYDLNISATLTLAGTRTAPNHMFLCYSKWEQDGGAVMPTDEAEQFLASGWWLPTAVPGNVAGGDNLGDYHLECNPPDGFTSTGQWVDGGGGVLGTDPAGIGWYAVKDDA